MAHDGSEEFEIEELVESSTKESEALNDWFDRLDRRDHHRDRDLWNSHGDVEKLIKKWILLLFCGVVLLMLIPLPWRRRIEKTQIISFITFVASLCVFLALGIYYRRLARKRWSFEFGKSGNAIIDDFILKKELKWIPYNKFQNIEYLNEGGFGTIYKAIWSKNNGNKDVILKCHKNLNENLNEFLNEWKYHEKCLISSDIINFHGFTEDPNIPKYMVVMDYANKGDLRGNLMEIMENKWKQKLYMLYEIISGLNEIHKNNLTHCDFHDGNILSHNDGNKDKIYVSDLGLCKPVKSILKKYDIYGVMSFMAPEVLRGKPYTPASDIYSFSMIMWEFASGIPPFNNKAHDIYLSLDICKGERPKIIENTPQCYVDLMKKCWDEDPLKRPSAKEVLDIIGRWIYLPKRKKIEDINEELKHSIMEFIDALPIEQHNNLSIESHPQTCYTSRLFDFTSKQLNEILESEDLQIISEDEILENVVSDDLNSHRIGV